MVILLKPTRVNGQVQVRLFVNLILQRMMFILDTLLIKQQRVQKLKNKQQQLKKSIRIKVYKDGTEEIVSTDTVSRNIVNTSTTVINGTHVEQNCQDILAFNPVFQNQDGNYASTLNGSGMTIICDMTRDGGGWTKVAKVGNHIGVIESSSYLSTGHFLGSNNSSMAQKYFNDTNPEAILFLNTSSNPVYGTNDMLIVERNNASWGWTPSNYNNDANQTGRFYDASTNSWENLGAVIYASHSGNPWQESTFSFTINGMTNDYTGQYANRLVLGGTFTSGTTTGYTHSFYGTSYSEDGQVWYDNGEMEIWMK